MGLVFYEVHSKYIWKILNTIRLWLLRYRTFFFFFLDIIGFLFWQLYKVFNICQKQIEYIIFWNPECGKDTARFLVLCMYWSSQRMVKKASCSTTEHLFDTGCPFRWHPLPLPWDLPGNSCIYYLQYRRLNKVVIVWAAWSITVWTKITIWKVTISKVIYVTGIR